MNSDILTNIWLSFALHFCAIRKITIATGLKEAKGSKVNVQVKKEVDFNETNEHRVF